METSIRDPWQNSRLLYHLHAGWRILTNRLRGERLSERLARLETLGGERILARVRYCNRVQRAFRPSPAARPLGLRDLGRKHTYALDLLEYLTRFEPGLSVDHRFGDKTFVPDVPTLVKARPIAGPNENSILFKLNKVRHFLFVDDPRPFTSKRPTLVWRGQAGRTNRQQFLARFFEHPRCDVGEVSRSRPDSPWRRPFLTIGQQLEHRFVLSLEGNDVASNLKWILSSNSLCFMPEPRFETWFMEGRLVAGQHYVRIAEDGSDLEEKLEHYTHAVDEAEWILRNAHAHVAQFRDREREELALLLVLFKYFVDSGQLEPGLSPSGLAAPA